MMLNISGSALCFRDVALLFQFDRMILSVNTCILGRLELLCSYPQYRTAPQRNVP